MTQISSNILAKHGKWKYIIYVNKVSSSNQKNIVNKLIAMENNRLEMQLNKEFLEEKLLVICKEQSGVEEESVKERTNHCNRLIYHH